MTNGMFRRECPNTHSGSTRAPMMMAKDGSAWMIVGVLHALEKQLLAIPGAITMQVAGAPGGFRMSVSAHQVLLKLKEPKVTQAAKIDPAL